MARLKEFYKSDVAPAMMSKFGYKSVMQIPKRPGQDHRPEGYALQSTQVRCKL